jgi:hypothetical protein
VFGGAQVSILYLLPCLILGNMRLEDVVVSVLDTDNFECLLGRTVLYRCVSTFDPDLEEMHFDFKENLTQNKLTIAGIPTFNKVFLFDDASHK